VAPWEQYSVTWLAQEAKKDGSHMEQKQFIQTNRREVAFYRLGDQALPKLLLVHGNASSSAFFFPTIYDLSKYFDIAAPDLNGFGDTQASPIHSPTALKDWADDIDAFADSLGWGRLAAGYPGGTPLTTRRG
jgi:pimeloyl-ACP methyl ester carboxylesterase